MTPAAAVLDPASHTALYVSSGLTLYVDLPDTPWRASTQEQPQARNWSDRRIPLPVVETALWRASLRRLTRLRHVPPLPRIRSLAYFQPVVDQLLENPVPEGYLRYLRLKPRSILDRTEPNEVQKTTFPDDR
jgi:hypothetical protein